MRGGVAAMVVAALVPGGMTLTASSHTAGARNVALVLTLRYEMQCDYAGAGPLTVTFPGLQMLPKTFPKGSVLLAGKPTPATISGRRVTVIVPPHKGLICDLMGPGALQLTFTKRAGLDNPSSPGTYRFTATHTKRAFTTTFVVR
jgi:hypothetical protein